MRPAQIALPYFDMILQQLEAGQPETAQVFGRHVHWGYWAETKTADGSLEDFAIAAETLCQRVYAAAHIQEGDRLLDAGCGFGGTIASLNENYQQLDMTGINIDPRQLERARQTVQPLASNRIAFVEGDACELPFEDNSMDVVLAVECIFHFPSRERFFQEARRVLRPGGRLALSDFASIPPFKTLQQLANRLSSTLVSGTYGRADTAFTVADYRALAKKTGFTAITIEDITRHTLPTYPVVKQLFDTAGETRAVRETAVVETLSQLGLLRYLIVSFVVPG